MHKFKVGDKVRMSCKEMSYSTNPATGIILDIVKNDYITDLKFDDGEYFPKHTWPIDFIDEWGELIKEGKDMKKRLKQPVEHYEFMITWVEGRGNLHERPSYSEMKEAIGEDWGRTSCAYCEKYHPSCNNCPLEKKGGCGNDSNHENICTSPTWAEWLTHAYKLLDVLREIEKEEEVTYKVGQRFFGGLNYNYILCKGGSSKVALINLHDGSRWSEPKPVENMYKITQKEFLQFDSMVNGNFTLIEDK